MTCWNCDPDVVAGEAKWASQGATRPHSGLFPPTISLTDMFDKASGLILDNCEFNDNSQTNHYHSNGKSGRNSSARPT